MKEYRYIKSALGAFSAEHGYSLEEYIDGFKVMIDESPEYTGILKKEIVEACEDSNWNWVAVAQEVDFIGSDENEESVWESVKTLIWNVIAPNERAPK
jgi:hypothetical protein